jgi:hypothetical protein
MRFLALASTLLAALSSAQAPADFGKDLQAALGPYYAALVASSRGNIDQTQRQTLLFASRWDVVSREAPTGAPAALRNDPQWRQLVQHVGDTLQQVRERCRKGDMAGAHAQLESIRLALREIDGRHNLLGVDDYLTDFHDAMQRMIGHVAGLNEIVLKPKDFDDIAEDYQAAEAAWKEVGSSAGSLARSEDWRAAASRISTTLAGIGRELQSSRRPESLVPAIEGLREKYYTLLLAVSKARS